MLRALAVVAAAIVFAQLANAQDWPNRPLTMVAPFAAGGSTDAIARIVAEGLSNQLHQPVIVENIGGAGGMTGANRVAKAAPDGYRSCSVMSVPTPRTRRFTRRRSTTLSPISRRSD